MGGVEGHVDVSIILPAYNEATRIKRAVEAVIETIKETSSYEIIIAEDGSTDGTDKIASELSTKHPFITHIHYDRRLGKGCALAQAFKRSKGEIIVYMDVDLATNLKHLKDLILAIKKGYDFATGSRYLPESKIERNRLRLIASKIYNSIIRFLFKTGIKDHQCGFKAFKRASLFKIIGQVRAEHWFWDTEVLVRASRKGFKIKEIPVEWKESKTTKVRLLKDSITMFIQALRLWLEQIRQSS
ncbi:MAG: glycosyltransferase family 2 protein [Candidatus Brockarchaeota archaeon]|nr:glycosyltransferase family 2 protein [Candidatus Brockarchaeota archaeon]